MDAAAGVLLRRSSSAASERRSSSAAGVRRSSSAAGVRRSSSAPTPRLAPERPRLFPLLPLQAFKFIAIVVVVLGAATIVTVLWLILRPGAVRGSGHRRLRHALSASTSPTGPPAADATARSSSTTSPWTSAFGVARRRQKHTAHVPEGEERRVLLREGAAVLRPRVQGQGVQLASQE
jgi:hypothetical protein